MAFCSVACFGGVILCIFTTLGLYFASFFITDMLRNVGLDAATSVSTAAKGISDKWATMMRDITGEVADKLSSPIQEIVSNVRSMNESKETLTSTTMVLMVICCVFVFLVILRCTMRVAYDGYTARLGMERERMKCPEDTETGCGPCCFSTKEPAQSRKDHENTGNCESYRF